MNANDDTNGEVDLIEWRKKRAEGIKLWLPEAELNVWLHRVSLLDLITRKGVIPKPMLTQINDLTEAAASVDDIQMSIVKFLEYVDVINVIFQAAIMRPKVTDAPTDTTISVDEIPFGDRLLVFMRASRGIKKLEPFRQESN